MEESEFLKPDSSDPREKRVNPHAGGDFTPTVSGDLQVDSQELSRLLKRFRSEWHSNHPPDLESYLKQSRSNRERTLQALVRNDIDCRRKYRHPASAEDYFRRFPELVNYPKFCINLVISESLYQRAIDPAFDNSEYFRRFPDWADELALATKSQDHTTVGRNLDQVAKLNCPHCRNPIELLFELSDDEEVLCPSCGSSVQFRGEKTLSWKPHELPVIPKYELLEVVGRGAFGMVYRALDHQLDRIVALKIPRKGALESPRDEERFFREARSVAQLKHPGIVDVYSVDRFEGLIYLVSEFVPGVTLAQYLSAKRLSSVTGATLVRDLALALAHAHAKGVVHRDIKPSNIMLTADLRPRIMDFGLAKRDATEITMTIDGMVLGTPAYMSPEQAAGLAHLADARSDIYAVGVILFELLTGGLPFRGETRMLLQQVRSDEPPRPRHMNSQISRDLETICLKCLEKLPTRRYQSAGELADDLQRFLDDKPILARPVGRVGQTWRWCRRNPVVAGLISSVLVLAVAIATSTSIAYVREARLAAENAQLVIRERSTRETAEETAAAKAKLADENAQLVVAEQASRKTAEGTATENARLAEVAIQKSRIALKYLYAARMKLIRAAWDAGDISECRSLLDRHLPPSENRQEFEDLRDFEWYYFDRICRQPSLLTVPGVFATGANLVYSPDGKMLASANNDNAINLYDPSTGKIIKKLTGHKNKVRTLAFSSLGKRLASAGNDRLIKIWDPATGQELSSISFENHPVPMVAFSPDGLRLVASSGNDIFCWDTETSDELFRIPHARGLGFALACRSDGRRLAVASLDQIDILDLELKKVIQTLTGHEKRHAGEIFSLAYSPTLCWIFKRDFLFKIEELLALDFV